MKSLILVPEMSLRTGVKMDRILCLDFDPENVVSAKRF